jgi:SAM-dependent methyltransferase
MAQQLNHDAEFDRFAENYEALLKPWLKVTGSPREYFAETRMHWLAQLLQQRGVAVQKAMDFGCGTGISIPLLLGMLGAEHVIGVDTSEASLNVARRTLTNLGIQLETPETFVPKGLLDLVFCNGVFHHIEPAQRSESIDYVHASLRDGGLFAFWENNPWNPIVNYSMKHGEVDRNAVPIPPPEAHRLLAAGRFRVLRTDYLFFFPSYLPGLRLLEKYLFRLPIGGQYLVLAQKV